MYVCIYVSMYLCIYVYIYSSLGNCIGSLERELHGRSSELYRYRKD